MDVAHVAPVAAAWLLLSLRGAGEEAEDGAALKFGVDGELFAAAP